MKNKIKEARDILCKNQENNQNEIILKLKEITDKAELTYNDVKVKRSKSKAALQMMKDLKNKLDELLQEAKYMEND